MLAGESVMGQTPSMIAEIVLGFARNGSCCSSGRFSILSMVSTELEWTQGSKLR